MEEKNIKKISGIDDVAHFKTPKTLTKPTVINPDDCDWLFCKKPGGEKNVIEPGDSFYKWIIPGEKMKVGIWRALPGEGFWMDLHSDGDEFWYILKGECAFWNPDEKELKTVKQGEFLYVPAGVRHQSYNISAEEMVLLFCIAPVPVE